MKNKIVSTIFKYSQAVMLLVLVLVLSIVKKEFATWDNLSNVFMQQVPLLLILSVALTMSILTKGIDLSIGSTVALSSCVAAYFIVNGQVVLGVIVAFAIGGAIGIVNGLLITKLHLVPFIATYTMNKIVRGAAYLFMAGGLYFGFSDNFRIVGVGSIGSISNLFIIAIGILIVLVFILKKTTFGRAVYSIGMNKEATQLSGINTDRVLIIIYVINGLLASLGGLLYIARLNAAEATIGNNFNLQMMAATLIGGTPFTGGKGGVERTLIGVSIMMVLSNAMNIYNISSLWQDAVFGGVIVLSLLMDKLGEKLSVTT